MNTNLALYICGILFAVSALACLIVFSFRSRRGKSEGLHPLVFAAIGLIVAAKLCSVLRFEPADGLLLDAFVCFGLLFGMVAGYARTYFGTWKDEDSQLRSPPVV
jgi:uncharacterized membrane protein